MLQDFFNYFDRVFICLLIAREDPRKLKYREEVLDNFSQEVMPHVVTRAYTSVFKDYKELFSAVDSKASALLTHISVMIAATAFMIDAAERIIPEQYRFVPYLLLLMFIFIALLVLRIIRFWTFDFPDFQRVIGNDESCEAGWKHADPKMDLQAELSLSFRRELYFRSRIYKLSLNMTSLVTILSFFFIVFLMI